MNSTVACHPYGRDRQTDSTDRQTDRQYSRLSLWALPVYCPYSAVACHPYGREGQTDSQTDRQADRQTDSQTDRQTERQTGCTLEHGPLAVALDEEGAPLQLGPGVESVLHPQTAGVSDPARDAVRRLVAVVGPVVTCNASTTSTSTRVSTGTSTGTSTRVSCIRLVAYRTQHGM